MTGRYYTFVFALFLSLSVGHGAAFALHVPLKRLIFDAEVQDQVKTLTVINDTGKTQDYAVDWLYYTMRENGSLKKMDGREDVPGVRWVDDLMQVEPARFTLAPGAVQELRFSLRKTPPLAEGEYRAHFRVRSDGGEAGKRKAASGGMQLAIEGGIVMPLFVLSGKTGADIAINDLSLAAPQKKGDRAKLGLSLARSGNKSAYGDVSVLCLADDGRETLARRLSGIAVYTETPFRRMQIGFDLPADAARSCRRVQARFSPLRDWKADGAESVSGVVSFQDPGEVGDKK